MVKAIDEAVIKRLKQDLCTHLNYSLDPFTEEQICKLGDVAISGNNLITVINFCVTFEGYYCAFGGYLPQVKHPVESLSERVMRTIEEISFASFLFYDLRLFNCNECPACLIDPPTLGKYANCPSVAKKRGRGLCNHA